MSLLKETSWRYKLRELCSRRKIKIPNSFTTWLKLVRGIILAIQGWMSFGTQRILRVRREYLVLVQAFYLNWHGEYLALT